MSWWPPHWRTGTCALATHLRDLGLLGAAAAKEAQVVLHPGHEARDGGQGGRNARGGAHAEQQGGRPSGVLEHIGVNVRAGDCGAAARGAHELQQRGERELAVLQQQVAAAALQVRLQEVAQQGENVLYNAHVTDVHQHAQQRARVQLRHRVARRQRLAQPRGRQRRAGLNGAHVRLV